VILICTNELAGTTGYHRSVVELANGLNEIGYPIAILGFLGPADGSERILPIWPLDADIPVFALQTLAADGGRLLHQNYHPVRSGSVASMRFSFTLNQLAALRQLNAVLSVDDTLIFTSPVQSLAFKYAIENDVRHVRTVLQIHGDYLHYVELWEALVGSREVIDRLQTVANGLRTQFVPLFDSADVVSIPNFHREGGVALPSVQHSGVNIVLPASFQPVKNQLDAIQALSLVEDESVHLTLWGRTSRLNSYVIAVQRLIASLDLADRVHMPGFGSEGEIYSAADIVLMTSRSEGFGYPLIEAAQHGLPAVAYDFDFGPREVIEDGRSGYVVSLGDTHQLARRMAELAADESTRFVFGRRAREIYEEQFANDAITERYRVFLGPEGSPINLVNVFKAVGAELVSAESISHRFRVGLRGLHQVTVKSPIELHDVQIDNGKRITVPRVLHSRDGTRVEFPSHTDEVISYTAEPGSVDRHYLANTKRNRLEVLPYLRRDANYGDGTPPVADTIVIGFDSVKYRNVRQLARAISSLAKHAPRHTVWKVRQLMALSNLAGPIGNAPFGEASVPASGVAVGPMAARSRRRNSTPLLSLSEGMGRVVRRLASAFEAAGQLPAILRKAASQTLHPVNGAPEPARREISRHPWFPVMSGVDNFGVAINAPGGVIVRNSGSIRRPVVSIEGEYDQLVLRDAATVRQISRLFSYGEMFERICAAERDCGLFDISTAAGVYLWELGRSALIGKLAQGVGMWGTTPREVPPALDAYNRHKLLRSAPTARRIVFDCGMTGHQRTMAPWDDATIFVDRPIPEGYPDVDETNTIYPIYEFNHWRQTRRRRWARRRVPEVDVRPFEEALSGALDIRVSLGGHVRESLLTFLDQREFWTPVFERIRPEEVLVAAGGWGAGIRAAAMRAGALASDVQCAGTGTNHPTFWFGGLPHYGASRFYAWSEFWAARTNIYQQHVVLPQSYPKSALVGRRPICDPLWDICVVSEPAVFRRTLAFVKELARERPQLKVVLVPHAAQVDFIATQLAAAGLAGKITVSRDDALSTIQNAAICVGSYSTSIWEAAALGLPTYVIPVPGFEVAIPDIESGLFRLANSPHDLVPYEVPEWRREIFGGVEEH